MTWSYDPTQLISSSDTARLYQVRFLIADTEQNDPLLQDEEIAFSLQLRSSIWGAAASSLLTLAAKFSRLADTVQGDLHTLYSQRAKAYSLRANEYEMKAAIVGLPYAGGISVADKTQELLDPDRVQPNFNIGMMDNYLPTGIVGNETFVNGGSSPDPSFEVDIV